MTPLPPSSRPHPLSGLGAAWVLTVKDLRVAWSYRASFILGHITVIGSLVLFYFVSRVVGESDVVGGPDEYFRFIVVGMAVAGLIEAVVGASMGAARRDQMEGTLEAVASLPVGPFTLALGWLIYPMLDALIGVTVTLLLAIPLGMHAADVNIATALVAALLTLIVFAAFGFFGAAIVLGFQQGAGVVPLLLAVLALLSGVLFPIEVLPGWLQTLSEFSPLRHALDAARLSMLEGAGFDEVGRSLLILAGFAVALVPLSLLAVEHGLRRARRTGGLSRF